MANYFLKVNKDLFNVGLNPTEILILSQVMEFQTNTGDCFISDKVLADNFGVSESTVKRELKKLEELGLISRDTKNVRGGKERHIKANIGKIEQYTTSAKMNLVDNSKAQNELCTSVKMSLDKGQNETIKDNTNNIKEKDNNGIDILPLRGKSINSAAQPIAEETKPFNELTKSEQIEKFKRECGF